MSEHAGLRYLMADAVQAALVSSFQASAASSLPAERAFAETKRSEAPRLCHVASASRNQMIRQHLRQRQELLETAEQAAKQARMTMKQNIASLALQARPGFGCGLLESADAGYNAFMEHHRKQLQADDIRRRAVARDALARTRVGDLPLTEESWIAWFRDNHKEFTANMYSAGARRRSANRQLIAAGDVPLYLGWL